MWSHTCIPRKSACLHEHFLNTESLFVHNCVEAVLCFICLHGSQGMIINQFVDRAIYRWHKTFIMCQQYPWEIDSARAERVGQGEEGGFTLRVKKKHGSGWLTLSAWPISLLAHTNTLRIQSFHLVGPPLETTSLFLSLDKQLSC